jgi:hypothetical protein
MITAAACGRKWKKRLNAACFGTIAIQAAILVFLLIDHSSGDIQRLILPLGVYLRSFTAGVRTLRATCYF